MAFTLSDLASWFSNRPDYSQGQAGSGLTGTVPYSAGSSYATDFPVAENTSQAYAGGGALDSHANAGTYQAKPEKKKRQPQQQSQAGPLQAVPLGSAPAFVPATMAAVPGGAGGAGGPMGLGNGNVDVNTLFQLLSLLRGDHQGAR